MDTHSVDSDRQENEVGVNVVKVLLENEQVSVFNKILVFRADLHSTSL